jgi:LysR family transcriptional regulator, transcriptional activator of the cysJI operon
MHLRYLETYLEVVKAGSISKAAKKLYLSQPAVSFQIQKLEQDLGFRLINRDRNFFSVTREGKRFFRFAEYVFQEHKHLLYDLRQMHEGVTGNLSIFSNSTVGEFLLPPILSEFKEQNPSIDIKLTIASSFVTIDQVEKDINTVGFCAIQLERQNLEFIKITEDEVVLIVYPGHPLSNKREINAADLMGESLILRDEPAGMRHTFSTSLLRAGFDIDQYQPKLILGTTAGLISAVEAKSGVALISNIAIKNIEATGLVKVVKIRNIKMARDQFCVYQKDALSIPLVKNFIEFAKGHIKQKH